MNLQQLRTKAGYSQAQLAQLCGINLRSLQDYEQGHKSIESAKGETLYRLSLALDCSINEILKESCGHIDIELDLVRSRDTGVAERALVYQNLLEARRKKIVHFPIVEPDLSVDMSRIYPTKQRAVKSVIDTLRGDRRIASLRLFGSSISMACNRDSDIDLAVGIHNPSNDDRNDISEKIQLACDWGADILWMDHLTKEDRVYKDIMRGVVLI